MHHATILIATRNRWDKLMATLDSIPPSTPNVSVHVVFDGDLPGFIKMETLLGRMHHVFPHLIDQHVGSVAARNWYTPRVQDGLLYATDDIVFNPGAIQRAINEFNEHFPDDDGVVGLKQGQDHHQTGVALVGQRFLQRYPDKKLFFPGYWHFAAQEVGDLANRLARFHYNHYDIKLNHRAPYFGAPLDETHNEARRYKGKDQSLYLARSTAGMIWGDANHVWPS